MKNTIKETLIVKLSVLASDAYQERYMIHGTKESYITLEDIVEEPFSPLRAALFNKISSKLFTEREKIAIRKYLNILEELTQDWEKLEQMEYEELLASPEWRAIVSGAQECLLALGVEEGGWDAIAFE